MDDPSVSGLPTSDQLLIPEGVRYNCQGCGRCCSGWSVGLTHADYSRVKDVDWGSLHPDLKDRQLFIDREKEFDEGKSQYPHFTYPRADGTCPFLIEGLCFIHGTFDEATKPGTCQLFPYSYVDTPEGVYLGVTYNSMASVRNIGELLTDQREKLYGYYLKTRDHLSVRKSELGPSGGVPDAAVVASAPDAAGPFDTVTIAAGCVVPWSEYVHLDNYLVDYISEAEQESRPFIHTLIGAEEILFEARRMVARKESLEGIKNFQPNVEMSANSEVSGTSESTIAMVYYLYLIYPTIRARYQDLWLDKRKAFANPKLLFQLGKLISEYFAAAVNAVVFKNANIPGLAKVNINKALDYKIVKLSPEINQFFSRWLRLKIFSKTYFGPAASGYPMVTGFNSLVAYFICAMLLVKGEALKRGSKEIQLYDLYEAFWRLDKEFLTMNQLVPQVTAGMSVAYSMPKVFRSLLEVLSKNMTD